ncbi:membrane protein [Candidatus Omnitrophus magneticus]|uniref:Membrane protein n=1 Tax=Candidatus Omnitrophus magneticus TaxID=1609969 RepID=A0A0F0CMH0_9BACT|nr:membrane protein [Candidatus Omnitrophus magneticus]
MLIMIFIISLILLFFMGACIAAITEKILKYNFHFLEFLACSFLFGITASVAEIFLFSILNTAFTAKNIMLFSALPITVGSIIVFNKLPCLAHALKIQNTKAKHKFKTIELIFICGLIIQFLWIIFFVYLIPINSHDAIANYALKAKIFTLEKTVPSGFWTWPEETVSHADYPPFVPFLMTWIYAFTGFNDYIITMILPILYAVFLVLFYSLMKKSFTRTYSLCAIFILGTTRQLVDYATIIHADFFLLVFVTIGFFYFSLYVRNRQKSHLLLSAIFFSSSIWIKNEAILFNGVFILHAFIFELKNSNSRREALTRLYETLVIIFCLSLPWLIFKHSAGMINSDMNLSCVTLNSVIKNLKDMPILLDLFQQEIFGPKKWNIFWIIFFAVLIWKRKNLKKREHIYEIHFILLSSIGYFLAYMFMTENNLFFYVNTTISRFMLHFTGLALIVLSFLIENETKKNFEE